MNLRPGFGTCSTILDGGRQFGDKGAVDTERNGGDGIAARPFHSWIMIGLSNGSMSWGRHMQQRCYKRDQDKRLNWRRNYICVC